MFDIYGLYCIIMVIKGDLLADLEIFEVLKNSVRMAEEKGFIGVFGVGAGDDLWYGDLPSLFRDGLNRGVELNAGDREVRSGGGVNRGGLEPEIEESGEK